MMQRLQGYFFASRGPSGFGRRRGDWHQVPKINLLEGVQRRPKITAVTAALLGILLLEAIFLVITYTGLGSTNTTTEGYRLQVQRLQLQEEQASEQLQQLYDQIEQQESSAQSQVAAETAYQQIVARRIHWSSFLAALFGAQAAGISYLEIVTQPATGDATVSGTAEDLSAIVGFQAQIRTASDVLDLQSLKWEEGETSLEFSAAFKVRQEAAGE